MYRTKYKMSGHSRFHRHIERFFITYFSNHHNVRILTKSSSQSRSKSKSYIRTYLRLIESMEFVFHRIFISYNINIRFINILQTCIECCCLTRSSRSRNKYNAIRIRQILIQNIQTCSYDSQLLKWWNFFRFINNTHHKLFSPNSRKCIGTHINFFISFSN